MRSYYAKCSENIISKEKERGVYLSTCSVNANWVNDWTTVLIFGVSAPLVGTDGDKAYTDVIL